MAREKKKWKGWYIFMITESKWKELVKKWEKIGPVYQIPRRSHDRLKHFCDVGLHFLKGRKVLEIGANAGLFGYCIKGVAKSYIGLEPGNKISRKKKNKTDYFEQALITEQEFGGRMFLNQTVKEFINDEKYLDDFDTLVMCYALYHLSDKEVQLLKEKILPKCEFVIIQNREQKRKTKHNSYKFWKSKRVVKFFKELGYEVTLLWGTDRGVGEAFSEIICKRVHPFNMIGSSKKKVVKKSVKKKVVKKVEKNIGQNKTDKAGEAPVSARRNPPDRQRQVD